MRMINRFQNMPIVDATAMDVRLQFRAQTTEDSLTIFVHDVIGEGFTGLDSASLVPLIMESAGTPIMLNINSPGGFVFDAIAIYTALVLHDADVRADIIGQAASAATILSSAADTVRIAASAPFTIHRAFTIAMGNASEFEALAIDLRAVDLEIANVLADKSGREVSEITEMMIGIDGADGSTFIGQAAVDEGFADEVIGLKHKSKASKGKTHKSKASKGKTVSNIKERYMRATIAQLRIPQTLTKSRVR